MLGCWGAFLGLIPPVFLTDEVEGLDKKDMLYAGALGIVGLVVPIITVPTATGTVVKAWSDRALDVYRHNLRENRPAVEQATARVGDYFRQRGLSGAGLQQETSRVLGGFVALRSRGPRLPKRPAVSQPGYARHGIRGRNTTGPRRPRVAGSARVRLLLILPLGSLRPHAYTEPCPPPALSPCSRRTRTPCSRARLGKPGLVRVPLAAPKNGGGPYEPVE